MTISSKIKLGPKAAALLLTVLVVEGTEFGSDLANYLGLHYLLELCRVFVRRPNTNLDATKKAIALAEVYILMCSLDGTLGLLERKKLKPEQAAAIRTLSWYPNERTYKSWSHYYEPERYLEVKIVPVEQYLESENRLTQRYSGYTKGYHESGKGYRRDGMVYGVGKTPFDPEIDEDRTSEPVDLSSPIDTDPEYQNMISLISSAKEQRRKK